MRMNSEMLAASQTKKLDTCESIPLQPIRHSVSIGRHGVAKRTRRTPGFEGRVLVVAIRVVGMDAVSPL